MPSTTGQLQFSLRALLVAVSVLAFASALMAICYDAIRATVTRNEITVRDYRTSTVLTNSGGRGRAAASASPGRMALSRRCPGNSATGASLAGRASDKYEPSAASSAPATAAATSGNRAR